MWVSDAEGLSVEYFMSSTNVRGMSLTVIGDDWLLSGLQGNLFIFVDILRHAGHGTSPLAPCSLKSSGTHAHKVKTLQTCIHTHTQTILIIILAQVRTKTGIWHFLTFLKFPTQFLFLDFLHFSFLGISDSMRSVSLLYNHFSHLSELQWQCGLKSWPLAVEL